MKKLAIVSTHPIQYNAPLFKMLNERYKIIVKVFYTWSQTVEGKKFDPGFGQKVEWDIPLLEGYEYSFVENIAINPGSHHYNGINNPMLIKEIEEWGANALLMYGWNFKSHLSAIRYFNKKIPVFFRGDSTLLKRKKDVKQILRKFFLRYVYSHIDIAFYAGFANQAYFKKMGLSDEKLVFMPHAIDNVRFAKNKKYESEACQLKIQLDIENDALLFLYAGKLDNNKNIELLIDAFISLNTKKHYLVIAGNGNEETKLKEKAKCHSNIKFLKFQNQLQMPALYAAADVFVLPSKSETWGLSINEAMAAGKPIIATDSCGATFDLIKMNENGFIINCEDVLSLTNALYHFTSDETAVISMGSKSLKIIEGYTFEKDCEAIEYVMHHKVFIS